MFDPVDFSDETGRGDLVCELRLGYFEGDDVSDLFPLGRGLVVVVGPGLQRPAFILTLGCDV